MRAAWYDFWRVLACGGAALSLVVLLARAAPAPAPIPFDPRPLERLKRERPELVLLGNSMVDSRFDSKLLNELVSPVRVSSISLGGTRSAVWYAQIKYSVVASKVRPRLALFFRGKELTQPRLGARDGDAPNLRRSMRGSDPVIERKLRARPKGLLDRLGQSLAGLAPVENLREPAWERVDALAMEVSAPFAGASSEKSRKRTINRLFAVDALRAGPEAPVEVEEREHVFSRSVRRSFLPDILELTRENGIALTLVRVKTRERAAGEPESPESVKYFSELCAYVEARGANVLDLAANEWETVELYGEGDHIAPRHQPAYVRRFVREYPELFRDAR